MVASPGNFLGMNRQLENVNSLLVHADPLVETLEEIMGFQDAKWCPENIAIITLHAFAAARQVKGGTNLVSHKENVQSIFHWLGGGRECQCSQTMLDMV